MVPRSAEPWVRRPRAADRCSSFRLGPALPGRLGRTARWRRRAGWSRCSRIAGTDQGQEGLDVLDRVTAGHLRGQPLVHLDTPLILLSLPDPWRRRTAVAAAADYFFDTWWRAVGSSLMFNTFPIDRRGGAMSTTPGEVLADGWTSLVFPEGTRSQDGWMGSSGWARPSSPSSTACPWSRRPPRHVRGDAAGSRNWPVPGRRQLTVRYGEPLRPEPGESPRSFAPKIPPRSPRCSTRRSDLVGGPPAGRGRRHAGPGRPDVATWRRVWAQTNPLSPVTDALPGAADPPRPTRPGGEIVLLPRAANPATLALRIRRVADHTGPRVEEGVHTMSDTSRRKLPGSHGGRRRVAAGTVAIGGPAVARPVRRAAREEVLAYVPDYRLNEVRPGMSARSSSRTAFSSSGCSTQQGTLMSSHREAPEISKDPVADGTDTYAFRSPDKPDTVTLIANFIPLQKPDGGPNFYEFGDDVRYEIHIDNAGNGESTSGRKFNVVGLPDPTAEGGCPSRRCRRTPT